MDSQKIIQQAESITDTNDYKNIDGKILIDLLGDEKIFDLKKIGYYSNDESFFTIEMVNKILWTVIMVQKLKIAMLKDKKFHNNELYLTSVEGEVYFDGNAFIYYDERLSRSRLPIDLLMLHVFSQGKTFEVNKRTFYPIYLASDIDNIINSSILQSIKDNGNINSDVKKTYVMIDERTGYYKIGYSNNPKFRESTLQSENPKVKLLFYCESFIERELHKKYSYLRVRGEWFNLSENHIIDLYNVMSKENGFTIIENNILDNQ